MVSKMQLFIVSSLCILSIGCSNSNNRLAANSFTIVSDCDNLRGQEFIATAPNGVLNSGSTYGFPQNTFEIGQDSSGPVAGGGGGTRNCYATYGKDSNDPDEVIYSCFDNGNYACSIIIREN